MNEQNVIEIPDHLRRIWYWATDEQIRMALTTSLDRQRQGVTKEQFLVEMFTMSAELPSNNIVGNAVSIFAALAVVLTVYGIIPPNPIAFREPASRGMSERVALWFKRILRWR